MGLKCVAVVGFLFCIAVPAGGLQPGGPVCIMRPNKKARPHPRSNSRSVYCVCLGACAEYFHGMGALRFVVCDLVGILTCFKYCVVVEQGNRYAFFQF